MALARQLIQFNSYELVEHQEATRQHSETVQAPNRPQHISLMGYSSHLLEANIPGVIDKSIFLSRTTREDQEEHQPPKWQQAFKGYGGGSVPNQELPDEEDEANQPHSHAHLCLACSQIPPRAAQILFDIDSFLGFAHSLAFAKQGININLYPRF
jgi:hypothetical protein